MEIKQHSFEHGAMSIIQMGEELIGHPTTAINELIKNGYDADATECKVYIHYSEDNSFLLIYDNGLGMSDDTLFGPWLQASISEKRKENAKSEVFERTFLGSKGIGRLATMALGDIITVISKTNDEKSFNWISLGREQFRTDNLLKTVKFPGGTIESPLRLFNDEKNCGIRKTKINLSLNDILKANSLLDFKEGTLIVIENLDSAIKAILSSEFEEHDETEIKIEDTSVYRALAVLITPLYLNVEIQNELFEKKIIDTHRKIAKEKNPFEIKYGISFLNDNLHPNKINWLGVNPVSVLKGFDYRVMGKVTKEGDVEGEFICKRLREDSFTEEFKISKEDIFHSLIKKLKKQNKTEKELSEEEFNAEAGEFYFDLRIYDRGEEDSLEKLRKLLKAKDVAQTRDLLNRFLGLRISKNGFGVKPYGEEMKDWMELGSIRVQDPGGNVSTNQILGYLFFYSPENNGLKEKTNREGFYENKAFLQVKTTLQSILKNVGTIRWRYRLRHNLGRNITSKLKRPDVETFEEFINSNRNIDKIRKESEKFIKEVTTSLDNMEESLTFSQRLASLGTGAELIYHEMAQPISQLNTTKSSLELKKSKIEPDGLREIFNKDILFLGESALALATLRESLKPAIGKSRKQTFNPYDTFKKVYRLFASDLNEYDIKIEHDKNSETFSLLDLEYTFWISFLNIVNNAVYWLKFNKDNRKLRFTIEQNDVIVISNSGPFIPETDLEIIFEYGVTHRKEKNATGLGLAFTRSMLYANGWSIIAENRKFGPAFLIFKSKENE